MYDVNCSIFFVDGFVLIVDNFGGRSQFIDIDGLWLRLIDLQKVNSLKPFEWWTVCSWFLLVFFGYCLDLGDPI